MMLLTLDQTYSIGLDNFFDVLEPRSKDKMVRCVLVSAQKCLLCLGDLARYKEQVQVKGSSFKTTEAAFGINYKVIRFFFDQVSIFWSRSIAKILISLTLNFRIRPTTELLVSTTRKRATLTHVMGVPLTSWPSLQASPRESSKPFTITWDAFSPPGLFFQHSWTNSSLMIKIEKVKDSIWKVFPLALFNRSK